jgi:Domain of unknown function (DUF4129)
VKAFTLLILLVSGEGAVAGRVAHAAACADPTGAGASPARDALSEGDYPWYDADADRVRPVWPAEHSWVRSLFRRIERFFDRIARWLGWRSSSARGLRANFRAPGTLLLVAMLAAFVTGLLVLWLRLGGAAADQTGEQAKVGTAARLADLPAGIRPSGGDPWAEALLRAQRGDLAGAVVCLFAHQLIRLDQLGLIRIVPGRTGRQYVKGLRDPELADCAQATLALFESVYYGHRVPSSEAFERVWQRAQAFENRTTALVLGGRP